MVQLEQVFKNLELKYGKDIFHIVKYDTYRVKLLLSLLVVETSSYVVIYI